MNITHYFIKHPVIALILNLIIAFIGYLSLDSLEMREYPEVYLPKIQIYTRYPNASPAVVKISITNQLEDRESLLKDR